MTASINDGANLSTSLLGSEPTTENESSRRQSRRRSSVATIVEGVDSRVHAYERERVPDDRLKGWMSFFGLFSSRHTAGTEFAIGPLFVARGATAIDVIVGLFVGNLLAVLSWRFLVGPLACKKRLTGKTLEDRNAIMKFSPLMTVQHITVWNGRVVGDWSSPTI